MIKKILAIIYCISYVYNINMFKKKKKPEVEEELDRQEKQRQDEKEEADKIAQKETEIQRSFQERKDAVFSRIDGTSSSVKINNTKVGKTTAKTIENSDKKSNTGLIVSVVIIS